MKLKSYVIGIIALVMLVITSYGAFAYTPYDCSADLLRGAVLCYNFDGDNCLDQINSYDCTRIGDSAYNADTPFGYGKSAYFDGNDYLDTNFKDLYPAGTWTISGWVKQTSVDVNDMLYSDGIQGTQFEWYETAGNSHITSSSDSDHQMEFSENSGNFWNASWKHFCVMNDGGGTLNGLQLYINGVNTTLTNSRNEGDGGIKLTADLNFFSRAGTLILTGYLDDVVIWNETYIGEGGCQSLFLGNFTDTINISSPSPANNVQYNFNAINFNFSVDSAFDFNCSKYLNGTLNGTKEFTAGQDVFVSWNETLYNGNYTWIAMCGNSTENKNTTTNTFYIDIVEPTMWTDFVNETIYYKQNVSGMFNFTDNQEIHSINFSINGRQYWYKEDYNQSFVNVNFSNETTGLSGINLLSVTYADGHTANSIIGDSYKTSNGLFNNYIKYEFKEPYDKGEIKITHKDGSILDSWTTEKQEDRYVFSFSPTKTKSSYTFVVEADDKIFIKENQDTKYKKWLIYSGHWVDFYPYQDIDIRRITDNKVEVTINNVDPYQKELVFNSIGDLNIVTQEYTFTVINATETYTVDIFNNFSMQIMLLLNGTNATDYMFIEWNQSNFTVVEQAIGPSSVLYNFTLTPAMDVNNFQEINHTWYFNFTGGDTENTTTQLQRLYDIDVGVCTGNRTNQILNMSYFDELTDLKITLENAYNLYVYDGTHYYNQINSFSGNQSDVLCTNIPPANITYNWDAWGTFTLNKNEYITRIVTIDPGTPIQLSNNPTTNYSLFLIPTLNSSTVKYNWFTTSFQPINGIMRVYQCNPDGTFNLVESTPIIAGVASANIEMLSQAYKYDVVIGGVIFEDPTSYSKCHVESQTELTYYVDIGGADISSLIGLQGVECNLVKVGSDIATLSWEQNTLDTAIMNGCILAYRKVFAADQKIFENCTNSSVYTKSVSVPNNGNTYVVVGEIRQSGNIRVCGTLTFEPSRAAGGIFGTSGLIASFFLIASLFLIFAKEGEGSMIGGGIGIIAAFILGIFAVGWMAAVSMLSILIIVIIIGRYGRKPE